MKSKQQKIVIKEIRFGPNTDDHDLNFKTKHAINFLQEGNKVKAYVQFFGRSIVYKDQGFEMLKKLAKGVEEVGKIELEPKMEGRRLFMILTPKNIKRVVAQDNEDDTEVSDEI
jgi:translation initiation factor IF-3